VTADRTGDLARGLVTGTGSNRGASVFSAWIRSAGSSNLPGVVADSSLITGVLGR